MSIDFLRLFRTCFACNGRRNLSRVEVGNPHQFLYYHQNCLDIVTQNPSTNSLIIHKASRINYQLRRNQRTAEQLTFSAEQLIKHIESFKETVVLCENIKTSLKEKSNINNIKKTNKFKKIFGE